MAARVSQAGILATETGSPKVRTSQTGILVAETGTPKVRASQAGILAAGKGTPKARTSQVGILAIVPNYAIAGTASAKVEWFYPLTKAPRVPTEFRIYAGISTPDYSAPKAIVPYSSGFMGTFRATLAGLIGGNTYAIAVRARNASGEETNTATVTVLAASVAPSPVGSLTATAV